MPFAPRSPQIAARLAMICLSATPLALLGACAGAPSVLPSEPAVGARVAPAPPAAAPARPAAPALAAEPAAAPPSPESLEQTRRVERVAAPLLLENVALCKRNAGYVSGFSTQARDGQAVVKTIWPGSAAAQSGLLPDDVLLAAGASRIAPGQNAQRDAARALDAAMKNHTAVPLTIQRAGAAMTVSLTLSRACPFEIQIGGSDDVNSYTDTRRVLLTRGMLNAVRSDQELAYVLAKEMAHAILSNGARPGMRATIDQLTQAAPLVASASAQLPAAAVPSARLPPLAPYVPVTDATADKLALYLLVRAGVGIDDVPAFWQRIAADYPATLPNSHTALHPATTYRISVIKAVTAAIKLKQKNSLPLLP